MKNKVYVKPENIKNDMGGEFELDDRMQEIFELLEYFPEGRLSEN